LDRVLFIDGEPIGVRIRRSDRARRLRLVVAPRRPLEVVLPPRATLADVEAMLAEKRQWIVDKLAWARRLAETPALRPVPGAACLSGRLFPIVIRPGVGLPLARMEGGQLVVRGPEGEAERAVGRWYRREARRRIEGATRVEAIRLGVSYRSVSIRDPRTRWGSCSSSGALSFSWRLVVAPPGILEYVVIHELVHLRVGNHSRRFWRAVEQARPGWRAEERWLADHGHELLDYRVDLPPPRLFAFG
jgi:predicted metal-dependent hydrolase